MMTDYFAGTGGFTLFRIISALFSLSFIVGLVLVIAWIIKTFTKERLIKLGIILLAIGLIGWLLTISLSRANRYPLPYNNSYRMMYTR